MIRMFYFIQLVCGSFFLIACQEKEASPKAKTVTAEKKAAEENSSDEVVSEQNTTANYTLCKDLIAKKDELKDFSEHITFLCDKEGQTHLKELRSDTYLYKGGSTPKISEESSELSGNRTKMSLYTSNIYDCDASCYFKLTKLQQQDPSNFKTLADSGKYGFKYDADVEYKVLSKTSESVKFSYLNDKDSSVTVSYEGQSIFKEISSSEKDIKRYVVGTKLTNSSTSETIKSLNALVVINEYKSSGSTAKKYAEVFTLSTQTYDNNGDHAATLKKAKQNIGNEQLRAFTNASAAKKYYAE